MKTAMQELIDELKYQFSHSDNHLQTIVNIVQKAQDELLEKEKEQMIDFYNWMRRNDSSEEYFHYSDEDMLEQYLTKTNNL